MADKAIRRFNPGMGDYVDEKYKDNGDNTHSVIDRDGGFWKDTAHKVVNSADASGAGVDITDAPAAGSKRVMVDLVISPGVDLTVSIVEETSGTVMHGPYYLTAKTVLQITTRATPVSKLATANKKYKVIASGAGNITVETWSYSES